MRRGWTVLVAVLAVVVGTGAKLFQRRHGLPATGALDEATAVALRQASGREEPTIVRSVQSVLTELGVYTGALDGIYGPGTIAAVEQVKQQYGITKHPGQVDAATLGAMVELWRKRDLPAPQTVATRGPDLLKLGDKNDQVAALQRRLIALGFRLGNPDGQFGTETLAAVTAFQKHGGLDRDGVVGKVVREHLKHPTGAGHGHHQHRLQDRAAPAHPVRDHRLRRGLPQRVVRA